MSPKKADKPSWRSSLACCATCARRTCERCCARMRSFGFASRNG